VLSARDTGGCLELLVGSPAAPSISASCARTWSWPRFCAGFYSVNDASSKGCVNCDLLGDFYQEAEGQGACSKCPKNTQRYPNVGSGASKASCMCKKGTPRRTTHLHPPPVHAECSHPGRALRCCPKPRDRNSASHRLFISLDRACRACPACSGQILVFLFCVRRYQFAHRRGRSIRSPSPLLTHGSSRGPAGGLLVCLGLPFDRQCSVPAAGFVNQTLYAGPSGSTGQGNGDQVRLAFGR
jgi:hypothetical protein